MSVRHSSAPAPRDGPPQSTYPVPRFGGVIGSVDLSQLILHFRGSNFTNVDSILHDNVWSCKIDSTWTKKLNEKSDLILDDIESILCHLISIFCNFHIFNIR